jgi:N6-adenosine-specific RNA methylase IME4
MIAWPFKPHRPGGFDVICADPPWAFKAYTDIVSPKSAAAHYDLMSIEAIAALPVGALAARDAWLFLWTSAPMLDRGFDVLRSWGFEYRSRVAWRKVTRNGLSRPGPGYIVRSYHEDVLIGAIGHPRYSAPLDSLFDGVARQHSRKPDEFYRRIEAFAPDARRIDLFSRQSRQGWKHWGREAGLFDGAAG